MIPSCDPNDGEGTMKLIENLTTNARQVQQQVLKEILTRNVDTEYLSGFLPRHHLDRENFKKKVPIVNFEDIKPYIERVANGEPSRIISAQPISELLTSSGTSGGQPKMMPSTTEDLDRKTFLYNIMVPVMNQYVDGLDQGKGMYLYFIKPEISTPSGLMARPVLTSYYKSSNFRNRPFVKFNIYTSPDDTILCSDSKQSMYCQLLCGLIQRDEVLRVGAVFASAFLRAIKFLEDYWEELCSNIRTRHVSGWIADQSCRKAVTMILKRSDSKLADSIEFECREKSWEGIIKRLWPRTKYVDVIVTGSMAQYIPTLDFFSGGLPLVSTMYASSECYFGINLKPLRKPSDVSYTLIPNMAYFEFLPVEKNHEGTTEHIKCNGIAHLDSLKAENQEEQEQKQEQAVDLVDVKIGHYYELVVTTFTGERNSGESGSQIMSMEEIRPTQRAQGPATVLAIGTATPPNALLQAEYTDYYFRVTNSDHLTELKGKFKRMCDKSMITKRHMYLTEEILKKNPNMCEFMAPSLDARQDMVVVEIPKLGKEAAVKAIKEWGQPKSKITHLVFCTTSGVDMPGADFQLTKLLGLHPSVKRLMMYQQGCFAGGTVLRLAKDLAENNAGARVLVVCSEITAITFNGPSDTHLDGLVGQVLFGDGAAALIIGADPDTSIECPIFQIVSAAQTILPDSDGAIEGHLREAGLTFHLLKDVPGLISKNIEKSLVEAFEPLGISDWNSLFWIVHPGGPAILDQVESKLGLQEEKMRATRHVLSEYGNMSSACVLFILDEMRKKSREEGKSTTGEGLDWGVLFGFGPGLTVETVMLHSVPTI